MQHRSMLRKSNVNDTRPGVTPKRPSAVWHTGGRLFGVLLCIVIVSALIAGNKADSAARKRTRIYLKNSLYHQIIVYKEGPIVTLRFGRGRSTGKQSEIDLRDLRRHCLEYTQLAFCGLLYNPEADRILVVGLGGGVIPRDMHHYLPEVEIDVVELDAEIPKVAEKYFKFQKDEKLRVHVSDGRMFVRKLLREGAKTKYDIVILDAFSSEYIPFHLMTKEFLEELQGVLEDDGVVVANVFYANRLFNAELNTYLAVYGRCQGFFGARSGNALLVALGPEVELLSERAAAERAAALQRKHKFAFDLRKVAGRLRPQLRRDPQTMVLTDDRAPVNWLRTQPPSE